MEAKETKKCGCRCGKKSETVDRFPGAAIDVADDENVTKAEVKERTKTLDNNPRDSAM